LRASLYIIEIFTTIMILVYSLFASGSITGANYAAYPDNPYLSVNNHNNLTSSDPKSKDSLTSIIQANNEYIKIRYTKLIPAENGCDTIRIVTGSNNDLNRKNSLSTLSRKGDNNFITRNLFSLIIRENQPIKEQMNVNSTLYFAPFAGKKIGRIRIQQLDVFGPSLQDTTSQASTWIGRAGNVVHMKTTEQKLRKQLLFNSDEAVNPQLMADNEKIIRDLPYIQDVAILLSKDETEDERVNVLVIVKERFEYGASGSASLNSGEIEVIDQNMFGIGHQLSVEMTWDKFENPNWGGSFRYEISDLFGKFVKTGFGYTNTYRKTGWNAFLDRQFIASKDDRAGGISLERVFSDYYLTPYSYTRSDTSFSYLNSDVWFGRQFKNKNIYSNIGNVIIAGRYHHQNFYSKTSPYIENSRFRDHDFILGSFAISKRFLFKNNQVYGYGITEDIPYGRYAELATGLDIDDNKTRPYLHFLYSRANILNKGAYFKWQISAGGFLNNSHIEQGAILLNTNYFTNLYYINHHPYRFFVNMELLSGINRFKEEYLVINRRYGIRDFFSLDTKATNRLKINIETVRFWRINFYGFKFANYFFADAAFLSNDLKKILNDSFYGGVGFGFRVHNESLVFNVLELRLSWIPIAPKNNNPFVFNAFGQPKARFDDFLGGKPHEILYE
jgi:hypothetical protein